MRVTVDQVSDWLRGDLLDAHEQLAAQVRRGVDNDNAVLGHQEHGVHQTAGDAVGAAAQVSDAITGIRDVRSPSELWDSREFRHSYPLMRTGQWHGELSKGLRYPRPLAPMPASMQTVARNDDLDG